MFDYLLTWMLKKRLIRLMDARYKLDRVLMCLVIDGEHAAITVVTEASISLTADIIAVRSSYAAMRDDILRGKL